VPRTHSSLSRCSDPACAHHYLHPVSRRLTLTSPPCEHRCSGPARATHNLNAIPCPPTPTLSPSPPLTVSIGALSLAPHPPPTLLPSPALTVSIGAPCTNGWCQDPRLRLALLATHASARAPADDDGAARQVVPQAGY
jgi:hypothetical protein